MIFVLIFLHLSQGILDLTYPLSLLVNGEQNGIHWSDAIFGFILMNVLDFFSSLGFLYLFYKMGMKELRDLQKAVISRKSL